MVSYTHSLTGGLIQPSTMSYGAYTFKTDLVLVWPSSFTNNPHVTAAIMDLTAEEEGLKVILPDARVVSVGQNILLNNRGEEDIALYGRDSEEAFFVLKPGSSFYIYLTNNTTIPGTWSVIPFGQGAVVVTSVGAESDDPEALGIEGSPVTGAGRFLFKLSNTLRALSVFAKKGFATLTSKGWEGRQIVAGQNISVKDGDGEKGNPVIGTGDNVGFKNAAIDVLEIAKLSSKEVIKEFNIEKGAIHNALMAQNSTNIDKLRSSGHSCFVVGSDADYQYTEIIYGGGDLWKVPTQAKKNGSPSLQPLSVIFNENPDASFNIQKLNVGVNHAGVVGSVAETKVASFINVDNAHYGILSGGGGNPVSFRVLTNVWNNSPEDTALGKILKEGSVPVTRIQHSGQVAPFAMGWVASNGTLYKSLNVAKIDHTATGKYYISFQKVASSPKYIVLVTPYYNESQGIYAAPQSPQASYFSVFCTGSKTPQNFVDNSFFFVVWDF